MTLSETGANWDAQLRKGTLEMVILVSLKARPMFGLELLNYLHQYDTMQITEGTLYPLLDRLTRDKLIEANWQQEGGSRPRKYYALTETGAERMQGLIERWRKSVLDIETLLTSHGN